METDVRNDGDRAYDALLISFGILLVLLGSACRQPTPAATGPNTAAETYASGLGEIMTLHQATNFGFNRVQRPTMNPYPNQVFGPPRQ